MNGELNGSVLVCVWEVLTHLSEGNPATPKQGKIKQNPNKWGAEEEQSLNPWNSHESLMHRGRTCNPVTLKETGDSPEASLVNAAENPTNILASNKMEDGR